MFVCVCVCVYFCVCVCVYVYTHTHRNTHTPSRSSLIRCCRSKIACASLSVCVSVWIVRVAPPSSGPSRFALRSLLYTTFCHFDRFPTRVPVGVGVGVGVGVRVCVRVDRCACACACACVRTSHREND
jgi:hypothetical protein